MRTWLAFAIAAACVGDMTYAGPVYPGREWLVKPPAEMGLSADQLKAFSDHVGGFGCVVRQGYLAYSWGDPARRMDVASAAKPIYAHFLFKVVEDGRYAVRSRVQFGRTSVSTIEVLEGLEVGDEIILSDMSQWDGCDRIRLK